MILFVPASYNINYDMKEAETPWHLLSQDNGCKPWCSSCKPVTKQTKTLNTYSFSPRLNSKTSLLQAYHTRASRINWTGVVSHVSVF
jgi:hypothetical protein